MSKSDYGRGRGYAELTVRRIWRLEGLSSQEELFALSDERLLAFQGVGQKTLEAIRKLQRESK
jgi:hypothetical protein